MKSDTERKRFYSEKIHRKKSRLHVHLSKDLRSKLKTKKRAVLVHKSDRVKIMRGQEKGKEGRVSSVDVLKRKVYVEGMVVKNARGREVLLPFEPSNLLLVNLEPTEERKKIFKEEAFRKEAPKAQPKTEVKAEAKEQEATAPAQKAEPKAAEPKQTQVQGTKPAATAPTAQHKPAAAPPQAPASTPQAHKPGAK